MTNKLVTVMFMSASLFLGPFAQAQGSLQGAWTVTEVVVTGGDDPGTNTNPQASLYLFTDRHYSIMYVPGIEPRPSAPGDDGFSDDEIIDSFNTFIANSGSYEASGSTLKFNVVVARVPDFMGQTPEAEYSIQGDTLVITQKTDDVTTRSTLARLISNNDSWISDLRRAMRQCVSGYQEGNMTDKQLLQNYPDREQAVSDLRRQISTFNASDRQTKADTRAFLGDPDYPKVSECLANAL